MYMASLSKKYLKTHGYTVHIRDIRQFNKREKNPPGFKIKKKEHIKKLKKKIYCVVNKELFIK